MSNKSVATIAPVGIDIGKNSFHVVGLDRRGAIVVRQKWSRGQIEARLAAMPPVRSAGTLIIWQRPRGQDWTPIDRRSARQTVLPAAIEAPELSQSPRNNVGRREKPEDLIASQLQSAGEMRRGR